MKNIFFYFYGISVFMAISSLKCLTNDMRFFIFDINQLGTGPFHNCYIFFDFGFEFAEIFVIESCPPTPCIIDTRVAFLNFFYSPSMIRRVAVQ
jgi:hypothetical protein